MEVFQKLLFRSAESTGSLGQEPGPTTFEKPPVIAENSDGILVLI